MICQTRVIFGIGWPDWPLLATVLNRFRIDKGTVQRHREIVDEERKHKRRPHGVIKRLTDFVDSLRLIIGLRRRSGNYSSVILRNVEVGSSSQSCSLRPSSFALTNICLLQELSLRVSNLPRLECGCIVIRTTTTARSTTTCDLRAGCKMEIISSTCVDETFVTSFMHTSPSRIIDTGLAVVGLAEALHGHYLTSLPKAQLRRRRCLSVPEKSG